MPVFVIACPIDLGCPRVSLFSSTSFVVFGAFASMEDKNPETSFQISLKIRYQKTKLHLFLQKVLHCVITHQTKYSEPFLDVFSCVWHFCLHDRQLRVSRSRYFKSNIMALFFSPFNHCQSCSLLP